MLRRIMLVATLVLSASLVQAQGVPAMKIQRLPTTAATQIDTDGMERTRLERENQRLKAENAALKKQVDDFTALGGSNVHAYCPADNPNLSRNTSGAQNDCGAAGYTCDSVSGQCRTSCQTSNMCAGGFTCDTGAQQCVRTG